MSYVYFKNKPIFESQRPEYRNFLAAVQGAEEEDSCALILPESDILKKLLPLRFYVIRNKWEPLNSLGWN